MTPARKPLLLMILDGWGYREERANNAIALASTPCWDRLWSSDPHALLDTSGAAVGLPDGQMGNSEVGHMNIGAGRVVYQDFSRIERAIQDGSFNRNPALVGGIDAAIGARGTVHIMGLLSPGGVHSHETHFAQTIRLAASRGAARIRVHLFLDGRDTPPKSAMDSIRKMEKTLAEIDGAAIATVCGRYYAMDRDHRWERIHQAYTAIASGAAPWQAGTATQALMDAYARGESDEFVQPTLIGEVNGVEDGDSVLFINFRADRARELAQAFVAEAFDGFARRKIRLSDFVCMTQYLAGLPVHVAFTAETLPDLLAGVLATHGLRQLRIAETEKYAHVTFFFNGGQELAFPGEDRILIPSPKVATYDLQPQMSLPQLTQRLIEAICSQDYAVIVCNVANPDMVGHTGIMDAAIAALEAVDQCLGAVTEAIDAAGGEMLITADHGNIEQMLDLSTGQSHTAHTTNPVPLVFHGRAAELADTGTLRDIAPTMLYLLDLPQPAAMTGHPLLRLN